MPLHARQPADNALKSKMAAPGDANQKAFHVLLEIHSTWERCEQIERASVQTLFSFAFSCDFSWKARKGRDPPLSPAFSSLSKHSRLEAFKQTTNRWFVTIAWDGTGSDWIFTARSHILRKNENAKSGAFLVVIASVPSFLIVSFSTKPELRLQLGSEAKRIQRGFEWDSKCYRCFFIFPNFSRSKEISPVTRLLRFVLLMNFPEAVGDCFVFQVFS